MTDAPPIACSPKRLKRDLLIASAERASAINPSNHPLLAAHITSRDGAPLARNDIAVLTSKYWGPRGVLLSVGFLDTTDEVFQAKVLRHMNAWNADQRPGAHQANIRFYPVEGAAASAQVRVATVPGDGHWSYIGTDILLAPKGEPTMNLDGFSAATSEDELCRVVRHETGHTLGCPHEHMRAELVAKLDVKETLAYYLETEGWAEDQTRAQLMTPLEERSLLGTARPDALSIMCYQIPGRLTKTREPILGGVDIDRSDYDFIQRLYPLPGALLSAPAPAAKVASNGNGNGMRDRKAAAVSDCIVVRLPDDVTVSIPPEATAAQIKHVLKALG